MTEISEISATDLKVRLDKGNSIVLLDVRRPYELQLANLENSIHIEDVEIHSRIDEIKALESQDKDIVIYCRTGQRSYRCVELLRRAGLQRVFNLTGGLHAWSDDVDPSIMKY